MTILQNTNLSPVYVSLGSNEYTQALNTYKSHLLFELYQPIAVQSNVDVFVSVSSFKFCNSIYNVNVYHSVFHYSLYPSYVQTSFTVARGNYSVSTLLTALNANVVGFVFSFDEINNKITISNSVDFIIYYDTNSIAKVLGLANTTVNSTASSYTCDNIINLVGTQMLYVSTPNVSINSFGVKSASSRNMLLSVPVSVFQGDVQTVSSDIRHKIGNNIVTSIEVRIQDEDGNEVNFNNIDWFLDLVFQFSYKNAYVPDTNTIAALAGAADNVANEK